MHPNTVVHTRTEWLHCALGLSDRDHLLRHRKLLSLTPSTCRRCSQRIGRTLPSNCLRDVVTANLALVRVQCFCLRYELRSTRELSLLFIDAEGHDLQAKRACLCDLSVICSGAQISQSDGYVRTALLQPWLLLTRFRCDFCSLASTRVLSIYLLHTCYMIAMLLWPVAVACCCGMLLWHAARPAPSLHRALHYIPRCCGNTLVTHLPMRRSVQDET